MKRNLVYVIVTLFMAFSFIQTISAEEIENALDNNEITSAVSDDANIYNENESQEDEVILETQNENVASVLENEDNGTGNGSDNYQVNFQYEEYEYSMPGGSTVLLSTLNTKLGMDISLSNISEFTTSDATVLRLTKVADSNDYTIESLRSFDTEETITIKLVNGEVYIIRVTDPAVPDHDKILTDNQDGTYTLELTVTGESEKVYNNVNVIVILDVSGSMGESSGNTEVTYTPTNSTNTGLYGLIDGEYVPLTRQGGYGNRTFWYNGVQYTGQRYTRQVANITRLEAAQEAVNNLAESLLSNNGGDNPNDLVEIALITFSTNATISQQPTTSLSTFESAVNRLSANGGTNWEAALQQVANVNFNDSDMTYVIFVSDGAPTFHSTNGGYGNYNNQYRVYGSGYEEEPNMQRSYDQAVDDAQSVATSIGVSRFFTIFAYGTEVGSGYMADLTSDAGAPEGNFYDASDTAALQQAFHDILE